MAEKIIPNPENEDISLGFYGRFETMPIAGALNKFRDLKFRGRAAFDSDPDRMQIMNTVAHASDTDIITWATNMAETKDLENIGFYTDQGKKYRTEAKAEFDPKPGKPARLQ